jgi:hypothetical protein
MRNLTSLQTWNVNTPEDVPVIHHSQILGVRKYNKFTVWSENAQ